MRKDEHLAKSRPAPDDFDVDLKPAQKGSQRFLAKGRWLILCVALKEPLLLLLLLLFVTPFGQVRKINRGGSSLYSCTKLPSANVPWHSDSLFSDTSPACISSDVTVREGSHKAGEQKPKERRSKEGWGLPRWKKLLDTDSDHWFSQASIRQSSPPSHKASGFHRTCQLRTFSLELLGLEAGTVGLPSTYSDTELQAPFVDGASPSIHLGLNITSK